MGPLSACDSDRVSGPSDSGSRSTSGDTGEGEHEVWFQSESHISQNRERVPATISKYYKKLCS